MHALICSHIMEFVLVICTVLVLLIFVIQSSSAYLVTLRNMARKSKAKRSRRGQNSKSLSAMLNEARPDQWAAKEALRAHHSELVKLPLQDLLPDLFSNGLITEETQERILHPKAVFIKREANQLILQDVREAVRNRPECLDRFLKGLQSLQPAVGLSQRIRDTFLAKCANPPPAVVLQSDHKRTWVIKWVYHAALLVGVISFLCICAYMFGVYLPHSAEMHRTGLPQEPDYFVNREQEQEMIMQSVTGSISDRSHIITITGAPGYGKTTLANVCGHRFMSRGIQVRYVDLQHVCTIQGIIVKILYAVGSTVRDPNMEQLSRWARQRQNGVLVLVLDNVDCFTLSGEEIKKEFSRLIKDFIVKPSVAIYVILTTQYQLGYIDSFQLVALDRLSEAHAKELLLRYNPSLTANVTATLANFTYGNPLALQILSALLHMPNAPSFPTLLKQMHFNPVQALSPENVHEKLNHVFKVAIAYLSDADRRCFVVVCQFPDSFDDTLASAVLPHLVNEIEVTCLRHLSDRSLLEYNRNTQRYVVIPLLKTFVNSTSHDKNYRAMVSQFFQVYARHLLRTAMKKQLLSEVHLQNYLKANYLGVQYLINGFASWSTEASDIDINVHLVLPFALSTLDILPLLQPVDVVERFWFSVQKLTWNITTEGFGGHCHEYLEQAIEFETLLADYAFSTSRKHAAELARLLSHAHLLSAQSDKLQLLVNTNCTKMITLLRYLGHVTKSVHEKAVYQNLIKTIMRLASSSNSSSADADYNIGVIYFELKEYNLAVEFLNKSLTSNTGIQHLNAAKTMVLAFQRSGQQELAADTAAKLLPNLLEQAGLEIDNFTTEQSMNNLSATGLDFEFYPNSVQNATEMLNRFADNMFTIVDISIAVNATTMSLNLLENAANMLFKMNFSLSPAIDFYLDHCNVDPGKDRLSKLIWTISSCSDIANKITRHVLVHLRFQMFQARVLCDHAKAMMKTLLNAKIYGSALNQSELVARVFKFLVDMEFQVKGMRACRIMQPDSVECQMSRRQVGLLWQMQYELADDMALFSYNLGMLEQAKNYTEIALEKLPKSSMKKKWKVMVDHKLTLANIDLSLGNYWNAVYILQNCSLTIDKERIETVYQATLGGTTYTWQSHDLTLPESQFSILVNHYVFNASKILSAVVSRTVRLIPRTGIAISGSHLLFVSFLALLWLVVFLTLFILGSTLYCIKFICSGCSDRHNCSDKIRSFLFNIITVTFAFSHIVVFYAYVLHYHTANLLMYLHYL